MGYDEKQGFHVDMGTIWRWAQAAQSVIEWPKSGESKAVTNFMEGGCTHRPFGNTWMAPKPEGYGVFRYNTNGLMGNTALPRFQSPNAEENGHGEFGIGGGWSQSQGFHADATAQWSLGSDGQAKISAGYSEFGGFRAGASLQFHFAKEDGQTETLYVTEIVTPKGFVYLPTYTPGKFDNLARQFKMQNVVIRN